MINRIIDKLWYGKHSLGWLLWPFALIFRMVTGIRRFYLLKFCQSQWPVPLIVVGNLTVGGVGKTPLVIALAKELTSKGIKVGIVSRGYGARQKRFPHEVSDEDSADQVGDEPFLIAKKTSCPVVIAPKRNEAVRYLLDKHQCQLIISDDGLQHYRMGRSIEIVVIDGIRGLGNGLCLPAGPLREVATRLKKTDLLVVNEGEWPDAYRMHLEPGEITHLATEKKVDLASLPIPVAAVAAIGHPQRFFATLANLGITMVKYPFPDHHHFQRNELDFREDVVVMTEKDAVKCRIFAADSWYFLPVEAKLSLSFWQALYAHERLQGYI